MAPEATKVGGTLAADTVTTRHLVLDARRAVDSLHQVRDTICPAWIGETGQRWLDVAVRSADIYWLLFTAAIRRNDPTRFLARVELLCGLRILLDEAHDQVRAEAHLTFGALDDTEVTLRALRSSLSIHGRNPNPAAGACIRQVLAVIAADLDVAANPHQTPARGIAAHRPAPNTDSVQADHPDHPDDDPVGEWPTESEHW